jgi:hypothetical protein
MASVTKAYEDVTIALTYDDEIFLDAIIDQDDNNNNSKYVPGIDYYVRLYKSSRDLTITAKVNFGIIDINTQLVPENISDEWITLAGNSSSSEKIIHENFQAVPEGIVFDENLEKINMALSFTKGSKNIRSSQDIFGIYNVSYYTEYSLYRFRAERTGHMLITFLGE